MRGIIYYLPFIDDGSGDGTPERARVHGRKGRKQTLKKVVLLVFFLSYKNMFGCKVKLPTYLPTYNSMAPDTFLYYD